MHTNGTSRGCHHVLVEHWSALGVRNFKLKRAGQTDPLRLALPGPASATRPASHYMYPVLAGVMTSMTLGRWHRTPYIGTDFLPRKQKALGFLVLVVVEPALHQAGFWREDIVGSGKGEKDRARSKEVVPEARTAWTRACTRRLTKQQRCPVAESSMLLLLPPAVLGHLWPAGCGAKSLQAASRGFDRSLHTNRSCAED
eukprot:2125769-Rhodomonas_salina.2